MHLLLCSFCKNQVYSFYLIFFCQKVFTSRYMDSLLILLLQIFTQTSCPQCCFHGYIILNMKYVILQIFSIPHTCHIFVLYFNSLNSLACYDFTCLFIASLLVLEFILHEGRYFCLCSSLMSLVLKTVASTKLKFNRNVF